MGINNLQIACRCIQPLHESTINKIAMFCQVELDQVIAVHDVTSTYHVPLLLEKQGLINQLSELFRLKDYKIEKSLVTKGAKIWNAWKSLTTSQERYLEGEKVTIALVGKYTNLHDSYLSVIKSLEHGALAIHRKLDLQWIDSTELEQGTLESQPEKYYSAWHKLSMADGVLVPGGFGTRGIEGMIQAARWARTKPKPYLGICLGMQTAVIEYARNVIGIEGATSEEFDGQAADKLVMFMPEIDTKTMGGNMRLGLRPTHFQEGSEWSRLRKLYQGAPSVNERHRHRYEVNPAYIDKLTAAGLNFIGKDDTGERMEIVELKDHPFFVGVQFHPEYLSRVLRPSPPFLGFLAASAGLLDEVTARRGSIGGVVVNGEGHQNGIMI